jgi:hypothetical protein
MGERVMYKMTIAVPGGTMEVSGETQEELIKRVSFFQGLPMVCPIDGSDTRLGYRSIDGYDYYGLVSGGTPQYTYPFGRPKDKTGGEFFAGKLGDDKRTHRQWTRYDHDRKENIVVWEDGKLLVPVPQGGRSNGKAGYSPTPPPPDDDELSDIIVLQASAAMAGPGQDDGALLARRKTFNLAGRELYGSEWPDKCGSIVQWYTDNQVSDSDRLTVEQLDGLIIKLRNKKAKAKA